MNEKVFKLNGVLAGPVLLESSDQTQFIKSNFISGGVLFTSVQKYNGMEEFSEVISLSKEPGILGFVDPVFETNKFFAENPDPLVRVCRLVPELEPFSRHHSGCELSHQLLDLIGHE